MLNRELKRKHVTLQILWDEYIEAEPEGYKYSRFCELYRSWEGRRPVTMRQTYLGGEKLFVDYAGDTVPVIVDPASGRTRAAHIFVAVMGASSLSFACASWSEKLIDWVEGHVQAFDYFGGQCQRKSYQPGNLGVSPLPYLGFMARKSTPKPPPGPVSLVRQLAGGDPAGGDALREIPAFAQERRGPAARARDRHLPRDGEALVAPLRTDVRQARSARSGSRRCAQHTHWRWHLDEVYVKINGEMRYLWRAVDHEGEVLESFVTKDPGQGCSAEVHQEGPEAPRQGPRPSPPMDCAPTWRRHEGDRQARSARRWAAGLNNRAENSHQPFRRRERAMLRFQEDEDTPDLRLSARHGAQPFQPGETPRQPDNLQRETGRRTGCLADSRGIDLLGFG